MEWIARYDEITMYHFQILKSLIIPSLLETNFLSQNYNVVAQAAAQCLVMNSTMNAIEIVLGELSNALWMLVIPNTLANCATYKSETARLEFKIVQLAKQNNT